MILCSNCKCRMRGVTARERINVVFRVVGKHYLYLQTSGKKEKVELPLAFVGAPPTYSIVASLFDLIWSGSMCEE